MHWQMIFGFGSFCVTVVAVMIIVQSVVQKNLWGVVALFLLTLPLVLLLYSKAARALWAHLTLQFIIFVFFVLAFTSFLFTEYWPPIADKVGVLGRIVIILAAANVGAILSAIVGGRILRIKCPEDGCNGKCVRRNLYALTFVCSSCNSEYRTNIHFGRGRL